LLVNERNAEDLNEKWLVKQLPEKSKEEIKEGLLMSGKL
jgi:hypothetical protein